MWGSKPAQVTYLGLYPQTILQLLLTSNDRLFFIHSKEKTFFSGAGGREFKGKNLKEW